MECMLDLENRRCEFDGVAWLLNFTNKDPINEIGQSKSKEFDKLVKGVYIMNWIFC